MKKAENKRGFFNNKYICYVIIAMVFLCVAFFYVMASTLNPWSDKLPNLDSTVWLRCAVKMKQGFTMYVDTWDHKGPLLFLIQFLGLTITPHSLNGIWYLELLFAVLTLWALYFTAGCFSDKKVVCVIASALSFHPFYYFFQGGNCVEEWSLPFISFSLYFFVKYLKTGIINKKEILLAGMFMSCSFLLNGNLISVWACFIPVIFIMLVIRKKWKELQQCIVWFAGGAVSVLGVTVLVLLMQNSFSAFLEAYFGFNASYTSGVTIGTFISSMLNFAYQDSWFLIAYVIVFFILLNNKIHDWRWVMFLYAGASLVLLSMSGRGYLHYGIPLIPCMLMPLALIVDRVYEWCHNSKLFVLMILVVCFIWLRFDVAHYNEEYIQWTLTEEGDNGCAGGEVEDYRLVNEWIGNRWSEDMIDKWVVNDVIS